MSLPKCVHRNDIFNLNLLLTMVKLCGLICSFLQINLGWLTTALSIHKLTSKTMSPLTAE